MAQRTMNFYAYGLHKDTTVMLMFEPPKTDKLFKDHFPVVWKVMTFRAHNHCKAVVRCVNRVAFGYAQTDNSNLVDSAAWVEVKSGDMARISGGGEAGLKRFGSTVEREGTKLLVCKNSTNQRANISIGFVKGDGINQRYEPMLMWTGIGAKSNVTAQFAPVLGAYVTRDYKEAQLMRGEVETEMIWWQNINELDDVTSWNLMEDDASGQFRIEPAESL